MKSFTFGTIALFVVLIIVGNYWNIDVRNDNRLKDYQKETADHKKKIEGLEDSILELKSRLEIYDATWNYLRGFDSVAIDGVIRHIRNIYEYEEKFYYDVPEPTDPKIIASQTISV